MVAIRFIFFKEKQNQILRFIKTQIQMWLKHLGCSTFMSLKPYKAKKNPSWITYM